jgi:hypothetical protein
MTHFSTLSDHAAEAIVGGLAGNVFNQTNQFSGFGTSQASGFAVNIAGAGAGSGGFRNQPQQLQSDNRQSFAVGNDNSGTVIAIPLNL